MGEMIILEKLYVTLPPPQVYCAVQRPVNTLGPQLPSFALSVPLFTWDAKFSNVRAAVRVDLTAARYGLNTLDLIVYQHKTRAETIRKDTHHCVA